MTRLAHICRASARAASRTASAVEVIVGARTARIFVRLRPASGGGLRCGRQFRGDDPFLGRPDRRHDRAARRAARHAHRHPRQRRSHLVRHRRHLAAISRPTSSASPRTPRPSSTPPPACAGRCSTSTTLSLHGRPVEVLHPHILPGNRILALTTDATTAPHVAEPADRSRLSAEPAHRARKPRRPRRAHHHRDRREFRPPPSATSTSSPSTASPTPAPPLLPPVPGLPDDAFLTDGQLTKREVRAATLAKLAPYPGALLWDVGAGCGSIAIEWMRAARDAARHRLRARGRAAADDRRQRRQRSARPRFDIDTGDAPRQLRRHARARRRLPRRRRRQRALFDACWDALKPGGRLVANAVTIDGEAALFARQARIGGELARIDIADPRHRRRPPRAPPAHAGHRNGSVQKP